MASSGTATAGALLRRRSRLVVSGSFTIELKTSGAPRDNPLDGPAPAG